MKYKINLTVLLFFLFSLMVRAQKIDSILSIYSNNFQTEKIHIHFDKSIYSKGETVWLKIYLMAGSDFSDYSKNIYVDWFGSDGKLIKHTISPVFESSAKSQFIIPSDYNGQTIHAIAYTRWMLNFDTAFLFHKEILVLQDKQIPKPTLPLAIRNIHFFPEGGDLVNGLSSRVAFKANDQFGTPVKLWGAIKTGKGVFVDSFASEHDGMGSFSLEPQRNETYTAYWKDEMGETHITALPTALAAGVNMEVHNLPSRTLVAVKRTEIVADNFKSLNLVATLNQQLFYRSKINLSAKNSIVAQIPTGELPGGIVVITLFDMNWVPVSERIVFINNQSHQFFPRVSIPLANVSKHGKNVIEIDVPDTVSSNLSVSVTDANLIHDSSSNIISQFLLSSDIRGTIINPAYYFSSNEDSVSQHLDLVMLTHGWRRFKWNEIVAGTLPTIMYPKETNYIQVRGKIYGDAIEKLVVKPYLNLIVSGKDSSREFLSFPLDKNASFQYNKGIFFDTLQVRYMLNGDRKLVDISELRFQNGLLSSLDLPNDFFAKNSMWNNMMDSATQNKIRLMIQEQERLKKLASSVTLKEVVVRSKVKSPLQLLDERYAKGLFAGGDGYQFDISNDLIAQSALSVFTYLQGRVAGLVINTNGNNPSVTWRNSKTDVYVNDIITDPTNVNNIAMADVAYIKVFRPPFFGSSGGGGGGAIAIYTKNGSERSNNTNTEGLPKTLITGYTAYKEFYSPDYSNLQSYTDPDNRTTLYWNPYVFTDPRNHKVRLTFFNNDSSKKLRVIIEGVNADGKFARIDKFIQ